MIKASNQKYGEIPFFRKYDKLLTDDYILGEDSLEVN
jgi:hypothetical protein